MPPPVAEATDLRFDEIQDVAGKPRNPRLAASLYFLTDGMVFGTWAALIPSFKSKFALSEAQLSVVLLAIAAGAIVSMPATGRTVARHGSRANLRIYAPAFCVSLALLVLSPHFALFIAAAFLFGAVKGAFNVSVNSQAIAIENAAKKPIISSFHALWSLGGMSAALVVGAALKAGLSPASIAIGTAAVLLVVVTIFHSHLLGGDATPQAAPEGKFRFPDGKLLRIGIVTFMVLFAEGVMMDWSVVYARTISGAEAWLAPVAYGVFSGCMALGRLFGGPLISRLGSSGMLTVGGIFTTVGLAVVTGIHHWPATFLGLALTGFGLANLVPILFGAGGRAHEGGAGNGIATVSIMGYFGFLIGPPLVGGISHQAGLPAAFALVVAFAFFIAAFGNRFLGTTITNKES
ncbi:MFS transporter [Luteolibacter sp. SL250]|uniref:MFS transporter n=1 Tax=Luteolibacter sp. SL250 TaxID=2995170 RepID=UPI002271FCA8|nr:MFS transporter [Luteolibacter sp. SL250]WAC19412.1 MFS transporter [Luteolibacter sp. SL250]